MDVNAIETDREWTSNEGRFRAENFVVSMLKLIQQSLRKFKRERAKSESITACVNRF